MGAASSIEWTDSTWNPIVGCSIVSPGCTNCYAMKQSARIERMTEGENRNRAEGPANRDGRLKQIVSHYAGTTKDSKAGAVWTGKIALAPDNILTAPLRWKRPRKIFVNSMSDLFHEDAPDEWIDRVFAVMALAPQHTFQVLTKRSARMREYLSRDPEDRLDDICHSMPGALDETWHYPGKWPLPNVWLGISAEDQRRADERVPDLLATPAAVRFVSAEPLLSGIKFKPCWLARMTLCGECPSSDSDMPIDCPCADERLDWIIAGGESGQGARPMYPDWARSIRDQCAAAGVAFFMKQWGEFHPDGQAWPDGTHGLAETLGVVPTMTRVGKHRAGRLLDGRTHDAMPVTP